MIHVVETSWHGPAAVSSIRRAMAAKFDRIGSMLVRRMRENIGVSTAQSGPSRPGEYPHKDTGELQNSLEYHASPEGLELEADAPHAAIVEIKRPYMRRTIDENLPTIRYMLES